MGAATYLSACSPPPPPRTLEICKSRAQAESQGKDLAADDVSELVEACMLSRGWALKEDGPQCADSATTPFKPKCYYKDDFWGRLSAKVSGD